MEKWPWRVEVGDEGGVSQMMERPCFAPGTDNKYV